MIRCATDATECSPLPRCVPVQRRGDFSGARSRSITLALRGEWGVGPLKKCLQKSEAHTPLTGQPNFIAERPPDPKYLQLSFPSDLATKFARGFHHEFAPHVAIHHWLPPSNVGPSLLVLSTLRNQWISQQIGSNSDEQSQLFTKIGQ